MPTFSAITRVCMTAALCSITALSFADMTVNVGGRVHLDAALYDEDVTELGSGTEFRRLRLFASGNIDDNWKYKVNLDFADGEADVKDAYVAYTGLNIGTLKIGHFKGPFSLEEMDSSKYITFMERASNAIFVPGRRVGVGIENAVGNNTYALSIFGDSAGDNGGDEGIGIGGRFTTAPKLSDTRFAHFGVAFAYEEPAETGGDGTVRFRSRPESHVTSTRLVDGGTIADVSNLVRVGVEAAYASGGFSAQSEYMRVSVDAAATDVDYDGFYIYASYFPWGGSRPYKKGVFQRVKAYNKWEFAVRYSTLDLDDTGGGTQDNITFGVNYYVNPYLRFMTNYTLVDVEGGINGDEDPSILQMRVSFDFK
ncbi:MAG: porin [Pseudomonadota bacterium]